MAQKYYVIWQGHQTGIFTDWTTCKRHIDGYPGARYKSYKTRLEAEQAFAAGAGPSLGKARAEAAAKKKRPAGAPLSWGEAMAGAVYATFGLFWAFGVVPHQWLTYSQGPLAMRGDAILAGPGSTGWLGPEGFINIPVVITKATVSDLIAVNIYGIAFVGTIALWAVWQGRGDKQTDAVEKSAFGRPLVKV